MRGAVPVWPPEFGVAQQEGRVRGWIENDGLRFGRRQRHRLPERHLPKPSLQHSFHVLPGTVAERGLNPHSGRCRVREGQAG